MVAGSHSSKNLLTSAAVQTRNARQLVLLGILLQALHVVFGVTAIIGLLITQTRTRQTENSVYRSQLRWQLVTFWVGATGYAMGFYFWITRGNSWLIFLVFTIIFYRLAVSVFYWRSAKSLNRIIF